jgi:hypothetical protein
MIETKTFQAKGYYLFASLASGRTCYFESKEEIRVFRIFLRRYLKDYIQIHKLYLSSEGYQVLVKVRGEEVLRKRYKERCEKKGLVPKNDFLVEVWRIVSDQVRVFHSVFAKWVNRKRDRRGVLVQSKYKKYYFTSKDSFEKYISEKNKGKEIKGQLNIRYMVSGRWKKLVNWVKVRGVMFVESLMDGAFRNYVVENLINFTYSLHKPPP